MNREPRKPPTDAPSDEPDTFTQTGRVTHDDRGNAIWELVGTQQLQQLDNPTLSLADEPSPTFRRGYSPYDSGVLNKDLLDDKRKAPRKKDLKRLSEWMKLKKSAEKAKSGAE